MNLRRIQRQRLAGSGRAEASLRLGDIPGCFLLRKQESRISGSPLMALGLLSQEHKRASALPLFDNPLRIFTVNDACCRCPCAPDRDYWFAPVRRTAQAFRDLYTLTSAKLFGVCLRICGERQAAGRRVARSLSSPCGSAPGAYEPGRASPITWLATIARNRAIDWRRAQGIRRHAPIEGRTGHRRCRAAGQRNDGRATRPRITCRIALMGWTSNQRIAIRTAFFDGVTYAELAERQAVPLGTMKSWVRRGLARLKECLER